MRQYVVYYLVWDGSWAIRTFTRARSWPAIEFNESVLMVPPDSWEC